MQVIFEHDGQPLVAEVQLHLRAIFAAAKEVHASYEVVRAVEPQEVVGPPFKWEPKRMSDPDRRAMTAMSLVKTSLAASLGASTLRTFTGRFRG